jgi:hypothetical protein
MTDANSSSFPTLQSPKPKARRKTMRGRLVRIILLVCGIAVLALLVLQFADSDRPEAIVGDQEPAAVESPHAAPQRSEPDSLPQVEQQVWERGVVAIESRDQWGQRSHGAGFVVAGTHLVATSLHVSSACTEAAVRLADGASYDVAGYAAVAPQYDLALLALRSPPPEALAGLPLASGLPPARRTPVWAIGHPQGLEFTISEGEVSRVLVTSELPAASQRFLRDLAPASGEAGWIQHSAAVAPGSSGGPLVDVRGRVLGINTWIDREAHFHYALRIDHLQELLLMADTARVVPLEEHATAEARANSQLWRLSADRLRTLLDEGRGMRWQPQDLDDYRDLQQLAWGITVARLPDTLAVRGTLGDRLDELAQAAEQCVAELHKEEWNRLGQVTLVNEMAEAELRRPLAGLFFFATIDRMVHGHDGRRGLLARLAGFDDPVFLVLDEQLVVPEAGDQCLVVGVNLNGRVVQWGENPLMLQSAPIIVPGAMIKLE